MDKRYNKKDSLRTYTNRVIRLQYTQLTEIISESLIIILALGEILL